MDGGLEQTASPSTGSAEGCFNFRASRTATQPPFGAGTS